MKNKKLIPVMFFVSVILVALIILLLPKKSVNNKAVPVKADSQAEIDKLKAKTKINQRPAKRTGFSTNDEIKREYGRLEKVYLWNGQSYVGAVIETKENYKMVTVDGLKVFSMSELKQREIIR